jgi:hypothetical protein
VTGRQVRALILAIYGGMLWSYALTEPGDQDLASALGGALGGLALSMAKDRTDSRHG